MIYLIQYTAYATLFYLVYLALLKNRVVHSWNRFYLIASATLPALLPLIKIRGLTATLPDVVYSLPEIVIPLAPRDTSTDISLASATTLFYLCVSLVLLSYSAVRLVKMMLITRKRTYSQRDGARIYINTGVGPGSIGRNIFFPNDDVDPTILSHELAHVAFRHTADLLFIRLLQCLFWPNVVLHLIGRELRMVHEFQADAASANNSVDFANLLLSRTFNVRPGILEHTFFHHPIKRRITMLQKKSDRRRLLSPAALRSGFAALLVTTGIIYLQSCTRKTMPEPTAYLLAEQMPHADYDLGTYLGNNIKYPEDAKNRKVEGRVIVKFIVDKSGAITKPEVVRSPDQVLSDEAVRVVSAMPKWQPGMNANKAVPVYFTLPISFRLDPNITEDAKRP